MYVSLPASGWHVVEESRPHADARSDAFGTMMMAQSRNKQAKEQAMIAAAAASQALQVVLDKKAEQISASQQALDCRSAGVD